MIIIRVYGCLLRKINQEKSLSNFLEGQFSKVVLQGGVSISEMKMPINRLKITKPWGGFSLVTLQKSLKLITFLRIV